MWTNEPVTPRPRIVFGACCVVLVLLAASGAVCALKFLVESNISAENVLVSPSTYEPLGPWDTSGFSVIYSFVPPWNKDASLAEIGARFKDVGYRAISQIDKDLSNQSLSGQNRIESMFRKMALQNYEGDPNKAYETVEQARAIIDQDPVLAAQAKYIAIYFQGVAALRRGENENCILCRGESSCILPIAPAAVHTNPVGSRLAITHFMEYLEQFPDDLEVRWLLNLAHMTLGEHPQRVDPRFLVSLDHYRKSEFDIGKFRDIGHFVGVNRLNQAGGGVMEDFDNDGLLDIAVSTSDPSGVMGFFRNTGTGTFEDCTQTAGLGDQLGGLYCVHADYNNDGNTDLLIVRGAWMSAEMAMRPSLLRNNGDRTFTDVTENVGLRQPVNSISASWADYDNDGWLDLFICCERQPNRLYHNLRDGTFEEVAVAAGVSESGPVICKGAAWIDYDNDNFQDLFLNHLSKEGGQLYRNNHDGTFKNVTQALGIDGPVLGFSCWAWDYNNDGWLDIFASCYDRTLKDIVQGLIGQPHSCNSNRLYRNRRGEGFDDVTHEAGLDLVFATMGSNFGDFDNDGFLDMYLGTGDPNLATLVPNRMFKNVAGDRFSEITASSGTGNLQKGHGVACGDWDCDGDIDIFVEMGGAVTGDKYHNILFQNPGQGNHWLTIKLIGQKTNRGAIGARIKVVTAGERPLTVHRSVTSGSSFGANPLQQTIGLSQADRIAVLEIHWPTSETTQVFRDLVVDQSIEVTEFAKDFRKLDRKPISIKE